MNWLRAALVPVLAAALLAGACGEGEHGHAGAEDGHESHEGHAHADETDEHEGEHADEHAHEDEDGRDGGHEDVVRLTPEQIERAGVRVEPVGPGEIVTSVTLPAEVGLNEDAVTHVTPRAPGIVAGVHGYLGQDVQAGDLLAVLESPALGEAKIAYLQAVQARAIAEAELERQRTISRNTETLLALLGEGPTLERLREDTAGLRIGENKGRLLSAYARMKASEANYARERELRGKGLSTQAELLAAQEAFNSGQAEYFAAVEDIGFTYRLRLQEAQRAARVASSSVENAERRLHLLGLSEAQVAGIADEAGEDVARYELTAPTGGRIVAKHITPGEKVGDEAAVYTIADLSTVWLNIAVYAQYAGRIREGQGVVVHAGEREAEGVVDYVSAVVSEGTRTVSARVVLDNEDRAWKPGEFVTVRVGTGRVRGERVVPIGAVQTWEGRRVVFVRRDGVFTPEPVELGRGNERYVELVGAGVPAGTPIVVDNSFLMKAELGKSAAGHSH